MRDKDGKPLTIVQLQKYVQTEARKMTKPEQIKRLVDANRIANVMNLDDVREVAYVDFKHHEKTKPGGSKYNETLIEIGTLKENTNINTPRNALSFPLPKKTRNDIEIIQNSGDYEDGDDHNIDLILQSIPHDQHVNMDATCIEAMKSTNQHGVQTASTDEDENIHDIAIYTI